MRMIDVCRSWLGDTWLAVLGEVVRSGSAVGEETRELVNVRVGFSEAPAKDPVLARFRSRTHVEEMRKVFFSGEANAFGHSYAGQLRGPLGRANLSDVCELLLAEPRSKRAVLTAVGDGDGRVPCINAIHFLRRPEGLLVNYFARGQDIFHKFCADGVCIFETGERVAGRLGVPVAAVTGLVSSAHVYLSDLPCIEALLAEAEAWQRRTSAPGVVAP